MLLSRGAITDAAVAPDQLRLLVYAAMASERAGSVSNPIPPLTATDEATRLRAMTLELLNLELQLVEPWAAAGSAWPTLPGWSSANGFSPVSRI